MDFRVINAYCLKVNLWATIKDVIANNCCLLGSFIENISNHTDLSSNTFILHAITEAASDLSTWKTSTNKIMDKIYRHGWAETQLFGLATLISG